MDKLRLSQKITRSSFTRAYSFFQAEKEKRSPDIISLQVCYALIWDKANELKELSLKNDYEMMIDAKESEEIVHKEMEHADEYAAKYQVKVELTYLMERQDAHSSTVQVSSQ